MTALSANYSRKCQTLTGVLLATLLAMPVAASTHVYQGSMVGLNTSGYLVKASADPTLRIVGVSESDVDNSSGAAGDLTCVPKRGPYYFANSSSTDAITDADLGRYAFVVDDATVARTSAYGARPVAGRILGVDGNGVLIEVGAGLDGSATEDFLVIAGADLSTKQYLGMDLTNSSGVAKAVACSAAGQRCVGVLQNAPASGAVAIIRTLGKVTRMISGGSVTAAENVGVTSAGKAKTAVDARVDTSDAGGANDPLKGSNSIGVALISGATDGDAINVLLLPLGVSIAAASAL